MNDNQSSLNNCIFCVDNSPYSFYRHAEKYYRYLGMFWLACCRKIQLPPGVLQKPINGKIYYGNGCYCRSRPAISKRPGLPPLRNVASLSQQKLNGNMSCTLTLPGLSSGVGKGSCH